MTVEKCFCPVSLNEAVALLERYGPETRICAGGTDLFVLNRKGKSQGQYLMDLSGLGLDYIQSPEADRVSIGAMTTLTRIHDDPLLKGASFQCLRDAAGHVGSRQIRNMATGVGNVCTGLPSADVAISLLALDAELKIVSTRGTRLLPLADFFLGPRQVALAADELITEIILPVGPGTASQSRFRKIGPRRELFISVFSIALWLREGPGHTVEHSSVAMGVMAPIPIRLPKTEAYLLGKPLSDDVIREALAIMQTEVRPRSSHHGSAEYRRKLAQNILRRYLQEIRDIWDGRDGNDR